MLELALAIAVYLTVGLEMFAFAQSRWPDRTYDPGAVYAAMLLWPLLWAYVLWVTSDEHKRWTALLAILCICAAVIIYLRPS